MSYPLVWALLPLAFQLAVAAKAHEYDVEEGDCLLASRSRLTRPQAPMDHHNALNQQTSRLRSWSQEHQGLFKIANGTTDSLEKFIKSQMASDDHCSARLMESKRTLDGLLKDLVAITEQVESHEELLATESENLNITHKAIEAVESTFEEDKTACGKLKQDAQEDFNTFSSELEELNQIANPEVRYTHAVNVSIPLASQSATALLGMTTWSQGQCNTFVNFTLRSVVGAAAAAKNLTCDEQRADLQKVYTETYIAVRDLIEDAKARELDESCMNTAEAKRTSEVVPLTSQRESAAGRIEYSTQALAMLEPVLQMLERRVNSLEKHIKLTLTPECQEAAKVTSTIKVVRDLIISLEKCPGRNGFRLQIPPDSSTSTEKVAHGFLQVTNNQAGQPNPKLAVAINASKKQDAGVAQFADSRQVKSNLYLSESVTKNVNVTSMAQEKEEEEVPEDGHDEEDDNESNNNEDDGNDQRDDNESYNDAEEEYDEIQTRVETKSTPNGTVTTYVDERVESDDDNSNESQ
eukprot:gnl/MRDRNA2_/MRDRNA2_89997_c0_seq1.p1 gnl/MRDRNA2_/MRDRNA2_89997_c0~~gnl/MRDRNA2_/MRDRNA2_89997_c0_seq1.p1  ORF type:complete len:522 (+),score=121.26 gnl/MRDRNA2_/MRDRNA2_89997_c0_seq1:136-1701(+)